MARYENPDYIHLEHLVGLLHKFYGYTLNKFLEINKKMGKSGVFMMMHVISAPSDRLVSGHIQTYEGGAALAQMLHYIGKQIIINNAPFRD
jgi:hypothetical protein